MIVQRIECEGPRLLLRALREFAAVTKQSGAYFVLSLVWARDKQIPPGTDLIKNRHPQFYGRFKYAFPAVA